MPLEWTCDYCGDKNPEGEPCQLKLDAGIVFVCKECHQLLTEEKRGH